MIVVLRDATLADCEHVYDWNFASDVRAVSNDPSIVALAQHAAWFADRLTRGAFWIVEYGNEPVGSVRIDDGRISIALAEKVRGRGIGRRAIAAACAAWARPVVAQVRGDNHPSRAAFEACGFVPNETAGAVVTYQWSP
jgi:RimJ/RimL family protein N-acetyltransferase